MRPRRESGLLRLFVAAYPPEGLSRALLERARSPELMDARWTPPSQVHLTLQFIGDTEERDLPRVMESVDRACSGMPAFTLTFDRFRSFPMGGEPKLIAATTDAPPLLLELHKRLAMRLARRESKRHDGRFEPHVTLCRFVRSTERVNTPAEPLRWTVDAVILMASVLHPSGAEHRELTRVSLTPRADRGTLSTEPPHEQVPD